MTTTNQTTAPDAGQHRKDADYARDILGRLRNAGMSDRDVARRVGLSDRLLRQYKAGEQTMSYAVQFSLEALLAETTGASSGNAVHETAASYGAPPRTRTVWYQVTERPLSKADVGKLIAGADRYGAGIYGTLVSDGFGLVIREIHPQAVDVHSVPVDRVATYTLLDQPE